MQHDPLMKDAMNISLLQSENRGGWLTLVAVLLVLGYSMFELFTLWLRPHNQPPRLLGYRTRTLLIACVIGVFFGLILVDDYIHGHPPTIGGILFFVVVWAITTGGAAIMYHAVYKRYGGTYKIEVHWLR
jgi:hypothetical protein